MVTFLRQRPILSISWAVRKEVLSDFSEPREACGLIAGLRRLRTGCFLYRWRISCDMSTAVLICDDSAFARRQIARALPEGWEVSLSFAANGQECLEAIRAGRGEVVFLDLNMPEMDGYQVLEIIRREDLPTMVFVVSGDIQPEAHKRVLQLGALDFLKKPVRPEHVAAVIDKYGLGEVPQQVDTVEPDAVDLWDGYREVANVAMGRAADLLARLLGIFVVMPIPNVHMLSRSELEMALEDIARGERVSAVCQGFIAPGVAGEALLIFNESSMRDIARLLKQEGPLNEALQVELLMDIASILISACLKGIAEQVDLSFSQGPPQLLGRHVQVKDLLRNDARRWQQTLAIEMGCKIERHEINCDLLLLFTEDSRPSLNECVSCVMG